jgi:acetylglutamate kinase
MRDKLTIVKVGGKVVEEEKSLDLLLRDFCNIQGYKLLVHGGGRTATRIADKLGIESKMVEGRRITDKDTLEVVTMVYAGLVNKNIVAGLQARATNAIGLTGADLNLIISAKRPVKEVDYGFVGDVKNVNIENVALLIGKGIVPVLAPITHDGKGQLLNTNADTIANSIAIALSTVFEVNLVYCFEKKGVLLDSNDSDSVIIKLTKTLYNQYKKEGIITEGMIPKLDNGFNALNNGVASVLITRADALPTITEKIGTELIL